MVLMRLFLNRNHCHELKKKHLQGRRHHRRCQGRAFPGVLRCSGGERNEAEDGATDAGAQNCGDHVNRPE